MVDPSGSTAPLANPDLPDTLLANYEEARSIFGASPRGAADGVRVTGNNAVHAGQLDVDDIGTATQLFRLLNIIVDSTISQPKHIEELFAGLPEPQRKPSRLGASPPNGIRRLPVWARSRIWWLRKIAVTDPAEYNKSPPCKPL